MTGSIRTAAASAAAVLLVCLTGCGGDETSTGKGMGGSGEQVAEEDFSTAADPSTCVDDAMPADRPYGEGFPQDWPFPAQTVVFNVEEREGAGTIVTGVTSTPFRDVLSFMNQKVVGAGFETQSGETEENDAEAEWEGNGFDGRWAIRKSATCPGETVLQVFAASGG